MFFFIAGVQPKKLRIDAQPRMCPSCGLYQARLFRVDHYFSVFFLPIFRVKKGTPVIECQSCGSLSRVSGGSWLEPSQRSEGICQYCGKALDPSYRYCPFCGRPI